MKDVVGIYDHLATVRENQIGRDTNLRMKCHIRLKHNLIELASFGENLAFRLRQKQHPAINDSVDRLKDFWGGPTQHLEMTARKR